MHSEVRRAGPRPRIWLVAIIVQDRSSVTRRTNRKLPCPMSGTGMRMPMMRVPSPFSKQSSAIRQVKHSGRCAIRNALRACQPLADCFKKSWPSFANTFMPDSSLAALARSDSSLSPTKYRSPVAPLACVAREHPGEDRPSRFHANEIVRMVHAAGAGPPVCVPKSEIDEVFRYRSYSCPSCATIASGIVVSGIDLENSYRPAYVSSSTACRACLPGSWFASCAGPTDWALTVKDTATNRRRLHDQLVS